MTVTEPALGVASPASPCRSVIREVALHTESDLLLIFVLFLD